MMSNTLSDQKTPRKAWAMLASVYFLSFMAPVCQFKIPPLASWIMPAYGLDGVTFGYLMSALSIIGFILAFPAAFICQRFGLKTVTALSGVCFVVGAGLAAATTSLPALYVSRFIEGVGIGLVGVAAPACVSVWFPDKTRGLALGIWATWMPVGIALMFNVAPSLANAFGYECVFWLVAILSLAALVVFVFGYRMPEGETGDAGVEGTLRESMVYVKNKYIWLLGIGFFVFNVIQLGVINSFYNTFLEVERGFDAVTAASLTSVLTIMAIVLQPVVGAITDRFGPSGKRLWVIAVYALFVVAFLIAFRSGTGIDAVLVIFIAVAGVAGAMGGGAIRPLIPLLMGRSATAVTMGMAVLQLCQNLGSAIGSPLFGWGYETLGWEEAGWFIIIPLLIVAIVATAFIGPKAFQKVDEKAESES